MTAGEIDSDAGALHKLSEDSWRRASREHSRRIREILAPGLTPPDHPLNTGLRRQRKQEERKRHRPETSSSSTVDTSFHETITALDPKNPVYNFLIEYYGLKGTKGVRRLLKWSPGMQGTNGEVTQKQQFGILLECATEQDFFTSLHAKGAVSCNGEDDEIHRGVVYSPRTFVFGNRMGEMHRFHASRADKNSIPHSDGGPLAPFLWYRSLLQRTLEATPVLHCYGLHEWAMQYQPSEISKPPSSKYQSHLELRVDQQTLNETVEGNTLFCSHVDAWKFFSPEALPRNQFLRHDPSSNVVLLPPPEERPAWLVRSEQPACVHTTMDLLKIALKLGPFCDSLLLRRILALTVEARALDVAASPYDAKTDYGVEPIFIETSAGRTAYKQRQTELMKKAAPVREDLLENYEAFLSSL